MFRNLGELWKYRALVSALVARHLASRYRGSVFGFVWSFLNPLCLLAVYTLVFQFYIRFDQVEHYSLFLFCGLLPWIWFSSGLLDATGSVSSGGNLITKALFPAQVLPTVSVVTHLVNFILAVPILLLFMYYFDAPLGWSLLTLPVVMFSQLLFLLGLSYFLAALNVHFRDVQHIVANLLTLWFFLCPILYPVSSIPERFRFTLVLNPVAIYTTMYQDLFLYRQFPDLGLLGLSFAIGLLTLMIGSQVFNYYREEFAELV